MTLTLSTGSFTCKKCEVTFNGTYKAQQRPRKSCPKCHKMVGMTVSLKKKKSVNNSQGKVIPPKSPSQDFIDDPDELLMSVSTRELNKEDPDPRWASILISVRKENIGKSKREGDIRSQFRSMEIKDIAKIISGKQKGILPKLDSKETS